MPRYILRYRLCLSHLFHREPRARIISQITHTAAADMKLCELLSHNYYTLQTNYEKPNILSIQQHFHQWKTASLRKSAELLPINLLNTVGSIQLSRWPCQSNVPTVVASHFARALTSTPSTAKWFSHLTTCILWHGSLSSTGLARQSWTNTSSLPSQSRTTLRNTLGSRPHSSKMS